MVSTGPQNSHLVYILFHNQQKSCLKRSGQTEVAKDASNSKHSQRHPWTEKSIQSSWGHLGRCHVTLILYFWFTVQIQMQSNTYHCDVVIELMWKRIRLLGSENLMMSRMLMLMLIRMMSRMLMLIRLLMLIGMITILLQLIRCWMMTVTTEEFSFPSKI